MDLNKTPPVFVTVICFFSSSTANRWLSWYKGLGFDLHNADKNSGKLGHGKKDTFGVLATLNKLSLEGEEDWMSHAAATITLLRDFSYLSTSAGSSLHIYLVKQRDEYFIWPLVNFYLICALWMLLPFRLGFPLSCFGSFKITFMATIWWPAWSSSSELFV